jgi:hypothetical protein
MSTTSVRKLLTKIAKVVGEYKRRVNTAELMTICDDVEPSNTCKSAISKPPLHIN